ncbi:MAG: ABC transporter ATP-binding protein [Proteobacteria bacterium]|nr:ABC transporter ATP-binding protein [Pseudomonadota bacterium]
MHEPLLAINQVSVSYGAIIALHNVSLTVNHKEIVALIGANGAGKSTLLMTIFAQPRLKKGEILYQGKPIHHLETYQIAKQGIAISPERRRIFVKMTTQENLLMGAYTKPKDDIKRNLAKVYDLFPILAARQNQRAGTLSGGEQQMLAMGRALMSSPTLFLLDEPSLGLAPQIVNQLFRILKEIAQMGTTILLVEQNAYHALMLADRAYVLVNGQIQLTGSGQTLLADPQIQAAYLGASA